ncbi:MAG: hypothetical protein KDB27_18510 [Planctomycetales bacterium]|nr:hypothetical protein [Planctomycetales bacterium]
MISPTRPNKESASLLVIIVSVSLHFSLPCSGVLAAEQERFVESFDGTGPFESQAIGSPATGLHNPFWNVPGEATFVDGSLLLATTIDAYQQVVSRTVEGCCDSYRNEIQLANVRLGNTDITSFEEPAIRFRVGGFAISVFVSPSNERGVQLVTTHDSRDPQGTTIVRRAADRSIFENGTDVVLAVEYFPESNEIFFHYDLDNNDDIAPSVIGPIYYAVDPWVFRPVQFSVSRGREGHFNFACAAITNLSETTIPNAHDYDRNGVLDARDIDLLTEQISLRAPSIRFDANGSGVVDSEDRQFWLKNLAGFPIGDSDVNGVFDSSDLVLVFEAAEYEDDIAGNSSWADGDWNGDGDFTSRDLVFAFQEGGFEESPHAIVAIVPEPVSPITALLGFCVLTAACQRGS